MERREGEKDMEEFYPREKAGEEAASSFEGREMTHRVEEIVRASLAAFDNVLSSAVWRIILTVHLAASNLIYRR